MKRVWLWLFILLLSGTVTGFLYTGKVFSSESLPKLKVLIVPLGNIDSIYIKTVSASIENYYDYETVVDKNTDLPQNCFVNIKSPRYRADSLLRYLRKEKLGDFDFVLGITAKDISTTKYSNWKTKTIKEPAWKYRDWGVVGLGNRPGPACIVSTFRLKRNASAVLLSERLRKVSCHEIGHNIGLPHCSNTTCFMKDAAESVSTIDGVEEKLCSSCQKKVDLITQIRTFAK